MTDEWLAIEKRLVSEWRNGQVERALEIIATCEETPRFRGRALVYRGSILEEQGRLRDAADAFVEATGHLELGSYSRFAAELSAGALFNELGDSEAALHWLRSALTTTAESNELFSGAAACREAMKLVDRWTEADSRLIQKVIQRSWDVLRVPGQPDSTDLRASAELLVKAGGSQAS